MLENDPANPAMELNSFKVTPIKSKVKDIAELKKTINTPKINNVRKLGKNPFRRLNI